VTVISARDLFGRQAGHGWAGGDCRSIAEHSFVALSEQSSQPFVIIAELEVEEAK